MDILRETEEDWIRTGGGYGGLKVNSEGPQPVENIVFMGEATSQGGMTKNFMILPSKVR